MSEPRARVIQFTGKSEAGSAAFCKRALVTGANGFIGAALVARLRQEGIAVRAVVRRPDPAQQLSGAEIVNADVRDAAAMRRLVSGCDVVFHVAAVGSGNADTQYQVNVRGACNVAEAAAAVGVTRLVHVSTVAIYGLAVRGVITETQPMQPSPRDFYQQSKALGEQAIWQLAARTGLSVTVVRPAFVYGPRAAIWTAALYDACCQLPAVPLLPGSAHPIFVADVVDLLLTVAHHPKAVGEVFHASADPAIPWAEFLGGYAHIAGNRRQVPLSASVLNRLAAAVRPIDALLRLSSQPTDLSGMLGYVAADLTYSMARARDLLGWEARTSLQDGMADCARWLHERANSR